ncbi:MAG: hypothetical protein ACYCT7_06150 [bacterium]
MNEKKLFLHIGTHKTGTTALQSILATNDKLLSDSGVLFPYAGRIGKYSGHHNIARELNGEGCFKKKYGTLENLCHEIKKSSHRIIILSSENFEYLYERSDKLQFFKDALERCGCRIEVIIFFRDHLSYAELLYRELLKDGLDIDFRDFTQELVKKGRFIFDDSRRFCFMYEKIVKGFARIFGNTNVHCETYVYPIELPFFNAVGLPDLYQKINPVKRGSLTNEPVPIIKSITLELYNKLATIEKIPKIQRQIGRNQIISSHLSLPAHETVSYAYVGEIDNNRFKRRFRYTIEYLRDNYELELSFSTESFIPVSKIYKDIRYHIIVDMLTDKALRISLLNPMLSKILRKFYKLLYFQNNLINN